MSLRPPARRSGRYRVAAGLVSVAVAASACHERARSSAPAASSSAPSASTGAVASVAPLAESIPAPPSPSEAHAAARKLSAACEALRVVNQRVYQASAQQLGKEPACSLNLMVESLGCTTAESGVTWGYRLAAASVRAKKGAASDMPSCVSKWRIELVRENAAGEKAAVRGGDLSFELGQYDSASVSLRGLSDYDADGEPELLRTVQRKAHEGDAESVALVLAYRAGRVAEYRPSRGVVVSEVEDVDGDGLLDLVGPGPYRALSTQSDVGANVLVAPPLFVHHAQRDGSFALGTPASRAYTQRQCPERTMPPFVASDIESAPTLSRSLICARLWGAEGAAVEARFKAVCPTTHEQRERERLARQRAQLPAEPTAGDADDAARPCREWVLALARVKPPFTFTP